MFLSTTYSCRHVPPAPAPRVLYFFSFFFFILFVVGCVSIRSHPFGRACALAPCMMVPQEIAFKEKREGDARDSWYIRAGFEGLLEEGLGKHYPPGEALQADADAKDRAKARR